MSKNAWLCAHFSWGSWLMLFTAFSFLMLGVDATMNHHEVIHEIAWSWTPVIFAPLAVLVSLVSAFVPGWRRQAWILGVVAILVGLAGTYFHNVPTILERGHQTIWQALLNFPARPVLAPASFAAFGVLVVIVAIGERCLRKPEA